jgi:hypothetical protein
MLLIMSLKNNDCVAYISPIGEDLQIESFGDSVSVHSDSFILSRINELVGSRTFQQNQLDAAQTRAVSVDADIQSIERNYRAAQLEATINKLVKEGQLSDEQAKNLRVNTFINSATADSQIKQKQYEAENAQKWQHFQRFHQKVEQ